MSDTPDEGQEPAETTPAPAEAPRPRVAQTTAIQRADDGTKSIEFSDPDDGVIEIIQQRTNPSVPGRSGDASDEE